MVLSTGTVVGQWKVIEALSPGGMGTVYRVQHVRLGQVGVLKVPLASADKLRFEREWQLLDRLKHPHIVQILDAGDSAQTAGTYFVTKWLPTTLQETLDNDGRLDPAIACRVAAEVGSALDAAHGSGVIHRDVKPSNILMDVDGAAYLSDFGVAHVDANTKLTTTGTHPGTVHYSSPELINGQELTGASDRYALACVVYEALVGRPPFDGSLQHVLYGHLVLPPDAPSDLAPLPDGVDKVFERALAKDPDARYPSGVDLGAALAEALGQPPDRTGGSGLKKADIGPTYVGQEWVKLVRELEAEPRSAAPSQVGPFLVLVDSWMDTLDESVAEFAAAVEGWHYLGQAKKKRLKTMPEKVTVFDQELVPLHVTLRPRESLWSSSNLDLIKLAAGGTWIREVSRSIWIPSGGHGPGQLASRDYTFAEESRGAPIDVVLLERDPRKVGGLNKRDVLAEFPKHGSRWTNQDLALLDELMLAGTRFGEVVRRLGRTPSAILSALRMEDDSS